MGKKNKNKVENDTGKDKTESAYTDSNQVSIENKENKDDNLAELTHYDEPDFKNEDSKIESKITTAKESEKSNFFILFFLLIKNINLTILRLDGKIKKI